jgi:hypothetical protein
VKKRVPNRSRGMKQHVWGRINQFENQQVLDRWLRAMSRLARLAAR